jgi:alanyl-tRNA synthetase
VLAGGASNYDTDVFAPIFAAIQKRCAVPDYHATQYEPSRIASFPSRDRKGADSIKSRQDTETPLAYLMTYHTYGTWLHGADRGSVDRDHNVPGSPHLDPDAQRELDEFKRMKHSPVTLDAAQRSVVNAAILEVAEHRGWEVVAINVRSNHVHVVVAAETTPERVMVDLKSCSTRRLVERELIPAQSKVWSRHGSTRYLWTEEAVTAAGKYVAEAQGPDLPLDELDRVNRRSVGNDDGSELGPLPHGRGSESSDDMQLDPLPYGRGSDNNDEIQMMVDITYRVVADHLRCLVFALTDGAVPSNEGRGYVLRRILRRAVRYGRQYFGMEEPFICDLVPAVVEQMADVFPELRTGPNPDSPRDNVTHIVDILRDEEASFGRTLTRGIQLFNEAAEYAKSHHHGRIGGEDAFKLHDTFGFPIDLTELMAEERGMTIDFAEYERLMSHAREKARSGHSKGINLNLKIGGELPATNDSFKYNVLTHNSRILNCIHYESGVEWVGGEITSDGGTIGIILDETCAYAEQGGQVGDEGNIYGERGTFYFDDTTREKDSVIHVGSVVSGSIQIGEVAKVEVENVSRQPTMKNHTSTHLLNWALREVLGDHVQQKGSLVDPEKTRFDFSHNASLKAEEISRIESLVNERIGASLDVYAEEVAQKTALEINTLRAVFGEKYPDVVRVVSIGLPVSELLKNPKNPEWMKYSVEFCGGTHLKNTAEAGAFVLVNEEAVAKGVRRVVGVTGEAAEAAKKMGGELLARAESLKSAEGEFLVSGLAELQKDITEAEIPVLVGIELRERVPDLQKEAKRISKEKSSASAGDVLERMAALLSEAKEVNGVTLVVGEVPSADADALRGAIDWARQKTSASVVLLGCHSDGKVTLVAGVSRDVIPKGVKAGDIIKEIAPIVGGRGGGRPDMAQGGGSDPDKIGEAMDRAKSWIAEKLS